MPEPEKAKSKKKFEDYEIESMCDTLIQAEQIKNDPQKKRLVAVAMQKRADAAAAVKASLSNQKT